MQLVVNEFANVGILRRHANELVKDTVRWELCIIGDPV